MKNLKNTIAAIGLMAVLGMGATVAKAGLIITDKPTEGTQCKESKDLKEQLQGIIVVGLNGIIVVGQNGLIISDGLVISDQKCTDGLIMSDGLVISD